jgi:putative ABC transport system permease protein
MRFVLVARHLQEYPWRSICLTLAFSLASLVTSILISVPVSLDAITRQATDSLRLVILNKTGPWYGIPDRYCREVKKVSGIVGCIAASGWPAVYRNAEEPIVAYAIDPDDAAIVFPDWQASDSDFTRFKTFRRAAFVGAVLAKNLNWKVGQSLVLRGEGGRLDLAFIIIGEIPGNRYPNNFVFRRDYLKESEKAHGIPEGEDAWALVARVANRDSVAQAARAIDAEYHNADTETRTVTESDNLSNGLSEIADLRPILLALLISVLCAELLVTGNSLALVMQDRYSEVCILRTLGFDSTYIATVLAGEALAIGAIGGIIGVIAARTLLGGGFSVVGITGSFAYLSIDNSTSLILIVGNVLVALCSAAAPIISALRVSPAIGIRIVH